MIKSLLNKLSATVFATLILLFSQLSMAAGEYSSSHSLHQAAWVPGSSEYQYGYRSISEIKIIGQPTDVDWKRWAMLHDGRNYRLYFFKKGSNKKIYQFAFNRSKNAYEFGYRSIPILTLEGAPKDTNYNDFSMLHDGKDYRLYLKKKGKPNVFYQFAWVPNTTKYKYGYRSIPVIKMTGFPKDTHWKRWQMLYDGKDYRFYAFKKGSQTKFYQGAFNRSSNEYEYGYRSIRVLTLKGMPAKTRKRAAMLHDGKNYRFYRLSK